MRDVDRYVDELYQPIWEELSLECVTTPWHRYVVDLNRKRDQYDVDAVLGANFKSGTHPKGLHWVMTTHQEILMKQPMSPELHYELLEQCYDPFHKSVKNHLEKYVNTSGIAYHLDLHSMPSKGTVLHVDPGQRRADVVVSDRYGSSSRSNFVREVLNAFRSTGLSVAYNWPYIGGGITGMYGKPTEKVHTVQVELNRELYMNEETKKKSSPEFEELQLKLKVAIERVHKWLTSEMDKKGQS